MEKMFVFSNERILIIWVTLNLIYFQIVDIFINIISENDMWFSVNKSKLVILAAQNMD